MKTYDMSKSSRGPDYVFCPHCAAKNPRKAYCCLKCFKVMFPSQKIGFLHANIPPSISISIIFASIILSALYLANRWLSSVEASMSLQIKTTEYNVALTADKKKNEEINEKFSVEKNPPN